VPDSGPDPAVQAREAAIRSAMGSGGARNQIWQSFTNQACVGATEDRARRTAEYLRAHPEVLQGNGVRLGIKTGYGGMHSWNVVEITDKNGKVIESYEYDDYLYHPSLDNVPPHQWNTNPTDASITGLRQLYSIPPSPSPTSVPPQTQTTK
jgi:hypothetical protein